jgi:hypothetical protein
VGRVTKAKRYANFVVQRDLSAKSTKSTKTTKSTRLLPTTKLALLGVTDPLIKTHFYTVNAGKVGCLHAPGKNHIPCAQFLPTLTVIRSFLLLLTAPPWTRSPLHPKGALT